MEKLQILMARRFIWRLGIEICLVIVYWFLVIYSMATYKTKAIVLSSYPYREHDRIVSFFSEEYGRIEMRARGTRKIGSKLAGHIEPFIEVDALLARGRRWDILAGSRTMLDRRVLRSSLDARAAASICVEAVRLITKPLDPDRNMYRALSRALELLDANSCDHASVMHAFLWEALHCAGFAPEISMCINCKTAHPDDTHFSCEGGGILCGSCRERDQRAIGVSLDDVRAISMTSQISTAARSVILSFWSTVIDYTELRSLRVWQELTVGSSK